MQRSPVHQQQHCASTSYQGSAETASISVKHQPFSNHLGFPGSSAGKESVCNAGDRFDSWVGKIPCRRDRLPTPVFLGFPGGSDSKEFACNAGDLGLILGWEYPPGEGNSYPLHYSCLENFMKRGAWWATVHGVTKS